MPITSDPNIPDFSDTTVVWRYMDYPQFVDLLSTRTFAMALASTMEDPYEGDIGMASTARERTELRVQGAPGYLVVASENLEIIRRQRLRQGTYLSCWHASDYESAAMWKLYGRGKGIALRSTWGNVKTSLTTHHNIHAGRVQYIDYDTAAFKTDTYTDEFFYKRISFSYESECRLVMHAVDFEEFFNGTTRNIKWPVVEKLTCDLDVLVDSIFVSPEVGAWVRDGIEDMVSRFGLGWEVNRSSLYEPRQTSGLTR